MKTKKHDNNKWFVEVRGSYLPASGRGWLSYVPFVTYLILSVLLTKDLNISTPAKVYFVITQWLVAGLLMTWLAKTKS